jgi:hypothetical protein
MTLPRLLGRPARQPRPVILSLTNHFVVAPGGDFRRECVVRMPDGRRVVRPVPESRLLELGLVAVAA